MHRRNTDPTDALESRQDSQEREVVGRVQRNHSRAERFSALPSVTNLSSQPSVVVAPSIKKGKPDRKEELKKMVESSMERLADQLNHGFTDEYKQVLKFQKNFWRYSSGNQRLIEIQKPDAAHVASYRGWRKLGRQVKKGATGAWILVPILVEEVNEETGKVEKVLKGFRDGSVFSDQDLTDIDSNPLPNLWKPIPEDKSDLLAAFIAKLNKEGITVRRDRMSLHHQGSASMDGTLIRLNSQADSANALLTCIHEYGHILMHCHQEERLPIPIEELEAESVSMSVANILGMEHTTASDYLIGYRVTAEMLSWSMNRIQRTVKRIVELLDIAV